MLFLREYDVYVGVKGLITMKDEHAQRCSPLGESGAPPRGWGYLRILQPDPKHPDFRRRITKPNLTYPNLTEPNLTELNLT